jgi:hypothetical protein
LVDLLPRPQNASACRVASSIAACVWRRAVAVA